MARLFLAAFVSFVCCTSRADAQILFGDVTPQSGIDFVGSAGIPPLDAGPPMGSGGAVSDIDGDGDIDVFLCGRYGHKNVLYINNGDGTFSDATIGSGLDDNTDLDFGRMAIFLDLDNDGDQDLIVLHDWQHPQVPQLKPSKLYESHGDGTFTNVTEGSGFVPLGKNVGGIGAGDYNNDGLLDLYVTFWASDDEVPHNYLYRGDGELKYTDVTESVGLRVPITQSNNFAPAFFDLDLDGWSDLYCAVDFDEDYLFRNDGGVFTDWSEMNVLHDQADLGGNDMGVAIGDCDGDGDLDVFSTNIFVLDGLTISKANALFINHYPEPFTDEAIERGVENSYWGWGTVFFDVDYDGDLDLASCNGRGAGDGAFWSDKPTQLFLNDGTCYFEDIALEAGFDHTGNSRALIAFDYDNDHDEDMLIVNDNQPAVLYENFTATTNHHLVLELIGRSRAREAPGTKMYLTADGKTQYRERILATSYYTGPTNRLYWGVGQATLIDSLVLDWPGGDEMTIVNIPVDQHLIVDENAPPAPVVVSLEINGPVNMAANGAANFTASAVRYYAPSGDVTNEAVWSVNPPDAAAISATGLLTVNPDTVEAQFEVLATLHGSTVSQTVLVDSGDPVDDPPPISVTVSITSPTTLSDYETCSVDVTLAGTAQSPAAVVGVSWSDGTATGECAGTASWSCGPIELLNEQTTITVAAIDSQGNEGTAQLLVILVPDDGTDMPGEVPQLMPAISVNVTALSISADLDSASFMVWSTGTHAVDYAIESEASWLTIEPAVGATSGVLDPVLHVATVDRTKLIPGLTAKTALAISPADPAMSAASVSVVADSPLAPPEPADIHPDPNAADDEPNQPIGSEPGTEDPVPTSADDPDAGNSQNMSTSPLMSRSRQLCGAAGWLPLLWVGLAACVLVFSHRSLRR